MTRTDLGSSSIHTWIELHAPVPEAFAAEIERRLFFVSPDITGFELTVTDHVVLGVTLHSAHPLAHASLAEKINYVVDTEIRPMRAAPPRTVWTSPHQRTADPDTFDRLIAAGMVSEADRGRVAIGEPLLSLLEYFDRAIVDLLAPDFAARQYRYPTLIKTETLHIAGYFANFPHHMMFVTRLRNDLDTYREFGAEYAAAIDSGVLALADNVDFCLPPTMCYHTFDQFRGHTLSGNGLEVVTARGKSFRFEAEYSTTLERLWDFTIREIVFLGERELVLDARERFMRMVFEFLERLGLSGHCEVANDPFFGSADTATRIWSQRLMDLKYEIRLPIAPAKTVAVGSFNFHGDTFGRAFGIAQPDGQVISSGCVGFGLERLVYAFLCQYGLDSADWPGAVLAGTSRAAGAP
ncbi:hypothetical protein AB0L97_27400 [Nocardia sp. NPDC051911]|uniref:hypothetical protein n=1 Tax=Nocardia sp. NPDC051911 TaxID=3154648 RepID=UPI003423C250